MSIYFKCNDSVLDAMMMRAELLAEEEGVVFNGYKEESSEAIRLQAKCVYDAAAMMLSDMEEANLGDSTEIISGNFSAGSPVLMTLTESVPERMKKVAVHCLSLLWKLELRPLLIYTASDLLAGVWLYPDADEENALIRSQDFPDSSYDREGIMLPFSLNALMLGKSFSEAVGQACSTISDYVCAINIYVEMKGEHKSLIRSTRIVPDTQGFPSGEFPVKCEEGSLRGLAKLARELSEAGISDFNSEITENHLTGLLLGTEAFSETKNISEAALMTLKESEKTALLKDYMQKALMEKRSLIIMAMKDTLCELEKQLTEMNLSAFVNEKASAEQISGMQPVNISSGGAFRKKRLQDAVNKYNSYIELLESETVEGITLKELIGLAEKAEAFPQTVLADFQKTDGDDELLFSTDSRQQFKEYTDAWESCIYRNEDGQVAFDLTEYKDDELILLKEMFDKSEIVISRFLDKLGAYGDELLVEKPGEEPRSHKEYAGFLMDLCVLAMNCEEILEAEQERLLPEATEEENKAAEEYKEYIGYRRTVDEVENLMDMGALLKMPEEAKEKLRTLADRILAAGLEVVYPPIPRQLVKDARELEELLRENGVYINGTPLHVSTGKEKNRILEKLCRISVKAEDYKAFPDNTAFAAVYEVFGRMVSKNGYIFAMQSETAALYHSLMEKSATTSFANENTKNCMENLLRMLTAEEVSVDVKTKTFMEKSRLLYEEAFVPFHSMEKEIFGALGLSYVRYDHRYEDRRLLDFIREWRLMFAEDGPYASYVHMKAILGRLGMIKPVTSIRSQVGDPAKAYEAYCRYFLTESKNYWIRKKKFDETDFNMIARQKETLEANVKRDRFAEIFNQVLAARKECVEEGLSAPVWMLTPGEKPEDHCGAGTLAPDPLPMKMMVADAERIPFYQVLGAAGCCDAVCVMVPERSEEEAEKLSLLMESATETLEVRAIRAGFPRVPNLS